jgi:hypothetical protein
MKGSIIYVGTSGSGKTMHMLKFVKSCFKNTKKYVLNDTSNFGQKIKSFESVDWDYDFSKLKKSVLICEDLICLSSKQLVRLATFVNVLRRHQDNTCVLITHSLRGNNLYSLIQHMNYFVFLAGRSNVTNYNVVCTIFKIPEDIRAQGQEFFLNPPGKYYSLVLNADNFDLTVIDPNYKIIRGQHENKNHVACSKSQILSQLQNVFKPYPNGGQLFAYATFLVNNLPPDIIRPDLSIKGTSKKTSVKLSLIDYVNIACSETATVSTPMKGFHKFLQSQLTIPMLFIKNKQLM